MCGIAGIVNFDGAPVAPDAIDRMTRALAHRGPDGQGVWHDHNVALGHRRLAIRDLGDGGRQPMHSPDGRVVSVINGELYNDAALRAILAREFGVPFLTRCDAEVMAPGWQAWGDDLFRRVNGMFAAALWDRGTQTLILARDPAGIKPLYFRRVGNTILFASEVKGLLAHPTLPAPPLSAPDLHRFLASGYTGPERSLLEGVAQVPPGTLLRVTADSVERHTFWRPSRNGAITSLPEAVDGFGAIWSRVVQDHLISDVPVGVLLSGGVDSALIAAELAQTGLSAFTGRFPLGAWDESADAAATAHATGLDHHVADIDTAAAAARTFVTVARQTDGHLADSSCVPFYRVCELARRVVPVLLSGDGADEFFGGYPTYRASRLAEAVRPFAPASLLNTMIRLLPRGGESRAPVSGTERLNRWLRGIASSAPGASHPQWRRYLMADDQRALYGPALRDLEDTDALDEYGAALGDSGSLTDRCLLADQRHYLPADMLAKADLMSMAHGLEIRVPFLDRRVMEFAGELSSSLLVSTSHGNKPVLRQALARRPGRPDGARVPKKGFNMPVARALREGLRTLGERWLNTDADSLSPWLSAQGVRSLWSAHQTGAADHSYVLWTLLTLSVWLNKVSTDDV